jgi:predicted nucleic acid-binding protein
VILYAESSAVLAWLLGEVGEKAVRSALTAAELVVASDLTPVECSRVLVRAQEAGHLTAGRAADLEALLSRAAAHWTLFAVGGAVLERARRPFPVEPLRTLDALHLATALVARSAVPGIRLLSLDERVRRNGQRLGFELAC